MPALTFEEFRENLHNWMNNLGVLEPGKAALIPPEEAEGFVVLLEEWQHGLFSENFPALKRLKKAISSFCEKIRDQVKVEMDVRARAAIFVFPDEEEENPVGDAPEEDVARRGVPQGWNEALREYRARAGIAENEGYDEEAYDENDHEGFFKDGWRVPRV